MQTATRVISVMEKAMRVLEKAMRLLEKLGELGRLV